MLVFVGMSLLGLIIQYKVTGTKARGKGGAGDGPGGEWNGGYRNVDGGELEIPRLRTGAGYEDD